ncbi:MAG: 3-oxoacyl-[acyl-carrier-protein] reductase [Firmicutes bacterium]|nr:3-oxoacyl-[acyl-carrier-protein] reductase [Bacillota bacterium]
MTFALSGCAVLVTGGSRGIGRAIALRLGGAGARVAIAYRSDAVAAEDVVNRVRQLGSEAALVQADVGTAEGASAAVAAAVTAFGHLDALVNNAGITRDGLLLRMKETDWDAVLQTNLKSAFLCTQAAARTLLRSPRGRIVNVSSVAGIMGNAGQANYAAAKAGMIGLTKSLAREFSGRAVTVNAVAPGFIETDMTSALASGDAGQRLVEQIPLRRLGSPEDVAAMVHYLVSEDAGYVTGQVFQVDGGLAM